MPQPDPPKRATASAKVVVMEAAFLAESRSLARMPVAGPPEIAIAGRSNVGKSTLLNRLAARKGLAHVSKTPGRTRGLVVFDLVVRLPDVSAAEPLRLVDLPGYGYAKVSRDERQAWQEMVEGYIKGRANVVLLLVLVDARRGLAQEELQLMSWLQDLAIPCCLVVTKSDKLGAAERGALRHALRQQAKDIVASLFMVSGETGEGVDALWAGMAAALEARRERRER